MDTFFTFSGNSPTKLILVDFQDLEANAPNSPRSFVKSTHRDDTTNAEIADSFGFNPWESSCQELTQTQQRKLKAVYAAMRLLTNRQREVLKRLYGIKRPKQNQEELAKEWKCTQQAISWHKEIAIGKVRKILGLPKKT